MRWLSHWAERRRSLRGQRARSGKTDAPSDEQAADQLDGAPQAPNLPRGGGVLGSEDHARPESTQATAVEMFCPGIDVGRKRRVASMLDEGVKKSLLKGFSLGNAAEGAENLAAGISEITSDAGEASIGMEAAGQSIKVQALSAPALLCCVSSLPERHRPEAYYRFPSSHCQPTELPLACRRLQLPRVRPARRSRHPSASWGCPARRPV